MTDAAVLNFVRDICRNGLHPHSSYQDIDAQVRYMRKHLNTYGRMHPQCMITCGSTNIALGFWRRAEFSVIYEFYIDGTEKRHESP